MNRREVLRLGVVAGTMAVIPAIGCGQTEARDTEPAQPFKLKYAPHFGMFEHHAGKDPIDQLKFMADEGFTALEDNALPRRDRKLQEKIASELDRLGMTMGVFVAHADFAAQTFVKNDPEIRKLLEKEMRASLELAGLVNAKWATVVLDQFDPKVDWEYQAAYAVENLKACAEICEPAGLTLVLEPLNKHNHPLLFLTKIGQAYQICKAVGSPSCKILNDLYHQQISEGNLIPNIDRAWDEIAYFQIGDNPGRKEPTTGEINYRNIFQHLHNKGYMGIVGMEHGKRKNSKAGERAVINAYRHCDNF